MSSGFDGRDDGMWDDGEDEYDPLYPDTGAHVMTGLVFLSAVAGVSIVLINLLPFDGFVPLAVWIIALTIIYRHSIAAWFREVWTGRHARREARGLDSELRDL